MSQLKHLLEKATQKNEMKWRVYAYDPAKDNKLVHTSKTFDCINNAGIEKAELLKKNPNYTIEIVAESFQKNEDYKAGDIVYLDDGRKVKILDKLGKKYKVQSTAGSKHEFYVDDFRITVQESSQKNEAKYKLKGVYYSADGQDKFKIDEIAGDSYKVIYDDGTKATLTEKDIDKWIAGESAQKNEDSYAWKKFGKDGEKIKAGSYIGKVEPQKVPNSYIATVNIEYKKQPLYMQTFNDKEKAKSWIEDRLPNSSKVEAANIDVKNPGVLEVPDGKKVDELPQSHFEKLVDKNGYQEVIRALTNLEVWNKDKNKSLSSWASNMADKLKKKYRPESAQKLTYNDIGIGDRYKLSNGKVLQVYDMGPDYIRVKINGQLQSEQSPEDFDSLELVGVDMSESAQKSESKVNMSKLKSEIQAAVNKYFKDDKDLLEYVYIDTKKDKFGRDVLEVRAELGYNGMVKLADYLDKIVTKYDRYAYFDQETSGIMTAVFESAQKNEATMSDIKAKLKGAKEVPIGHYKRGNEQTVVANDSKGEHRLIISDTGYARLIERLNANGRGEKVVEKVYKLNESVQVNEVHTYTVTGKYHNGKDAGIMLKAEVSANSKEEAIEIAKKHYRRKYNAVAFHDMIAESAQKNEAKLDKGYDISFDNIGGGFEVIQTAVTNGYGIELSGYSSNTGKKLTFIHSTLSNDSGLTQDERREHYDALNAKRTAIAKDIKPLADKFDKDIEAVFAKHGFKKA